MSQFYFIKYNEPLCQKANSIKLNLLDFGHAKVNSNWSGPSTSPLFSRLYYIVDGKCHIEYDGKKLELLPGNWHLIPSGFSCKFQCDCMMEHLYFHITLSGVDGIDLLSNFAFPFSIEDSTNPHIQFKDYLKSENLYDALMVKEKVNHVVLELVKQRRLKLEMAELSKCVQKAIEFINNHLFEKIDIATISEYAYVSKCTLSNKFRNELNITINEYIQRQKMLKAELLLKNSNMSVAQISEALGFSDQFYFSRCFKKNQGISPTEFRKNKLIYYS